MRHLKQLTGFRVVRFTLSGAVNTTVNFAVLNIMFYGLHFSKFTAIAIATSCAITVSFVLNRGFVFQDKGHPSKKLPRFIAVSVVGVFVVQNSVYALCILLLHNHESVIINAMRQLGGIHLSSGFVDVNFSNLIASFAVLFWNYNGYRLFVFNSSRHSNEAVEVISAEAD